MRKVIMLLVLLIGGIILLPPGVILYYVTMPFNKEYRVMSFMSKMWSWWLIYGNLGAYLKVEGAENIEKGKCYVLVANHNSMYDIPMVHLLRLNFRWVSKREVLNVPIIGWILAMQHSITIKRGDPASARKMMTKGVEVLKRGVSVAIFPEGTRSKTGKVGEFKAGAFIMAKSAEVDVLPVMLYGSRLPMKAPLFKRTKLVVKVLPPISIKGRKVGEFSKELNEFYRQELDK